MPSNVESLRTAIGKGGSAEEVLVLEGMLNAVEKLWWFRDSLDGHLESVEGLGLDWGMRKKEKEGSSC